MKSGTNQSKKDFKYVKKEKSTHEVDSAEQEDSGQQINANMTKKEKKALKKVDKKV